MRATFKHRVPSAKTSLAEAMLAKHPKDESPLDFEDSSISRGSRIKALACGLALALSVSMVAPNARATAVVGATEPTQILNHVELIAQYQKQLQQAITQVQMYIALKQQLQALPGNAANSLRSAKNGLSGGGMDTLNAAQSMLGALQQSQASMGTIGSEAQNAYQTLNILQAQGHGMTVQQYEQGMAVLAQRHADTYGVRMQAYQQAIQNERAASAEMDRFNTAAPKISSEVGGLTAVVQSNAVLGQQLANINSTLVNASVVSTQSAADSAHRDSDQRARLACEGAAQAYILGGISLADRRAACSGKDTGQQGQVPPNG